MAGCRLENTTEPSMCGSDAALWCKITFTTCFIGLQKYFLKLLKLEKMHCLYILYMFATLALRRCIVISHACALGLLNQHVKELIVIAKLTPLKILTHVQSLQPPEANLLRKNTLYIVYVVKVGPPIFLYSSSTLQNPMLFSQPDTPKLLHPVCASTSRCNACSLDPLILASQAASWSVRSFLHCSRQAVQKWLNMD